MLSENDTSGSFHLLQFHRPNQDEDSEERQREGVDKPAPEDPDDYIDPDSLPDEDSIPPALVKTANADIVSREKTHMAQLWRRW